MAAPEPELVYVFLPDPLGPIDRGEKYEDPIIDELERLGLGEVTGGGSSLGDLRPDGTRPIESCGIDVDTSDVDATREMLRALLPSLGCPTGTQLHFRNADTPLQDEFDGTAWVLDQHRTMLHPGFGV